MHPPSPHQAFALFDHTYIVIWSAITEGWALYITLFANGTCTPWSTDACLTAWPNHPVSLNQRW